MKNTLVLGTLSLITSALLVGCGGSSATDTTASTALTGYFIDAEVIGVDYETTSGVTGTTDSFGRFTYKSGDKVKLKIGKLVLGEVTPTTNGLVTPATLSGGDDAVRILLLRTLQSLDSDNNTSNGITIPTDLLTSLLAETNISDHNETTLLALDTALTDHLDEDGDDVIDVNATEATTHFEESTQEWDNGQRPDDNEHGGEGMGSNIGYLKNNHQNYYEHGTTSVTPSAVKDPTAKSINWTISASTEEGATKLADHINFMITKLKEGQNPRAWDKLFLMEAYMKFNNYYTTTVEQTVTDVVISKEANTTCAYDVISAHSDGVSGDFFGQGDISIDNSSIAETILASTSCDAERTTIEAYIITNQEAKPSEN